MKEHINLKPKMRAQNKSDFEDDLYKLMDNTAFHL